MLLSWFDTAPARTFAEDLAKYILSELGSQTRAKANDAKFTPKAQKTLQKAAQRLQAFKTSHALNFYKKSKLANAFLWALKDGGCPQAYADELTEWLTLRL